VEPGTSSPLRAMLIHLDALDSRAAYYIHHVGMWTMSETPILTQQVVQQGSRQSDRSPIEQRRTS
jgi:hypothetical protein